MHVVVERLAQSRAEKVVIRSDGIDELDVVVREHDLRWRAQLDAVVVRMQPNRRMRRSREPMPVGRLYAACGEELAHSLERIDRVLRRLRREAVHQIRM